MRTGNLNKALTRDLKSYQLKPQLMMPWHPGATITSNRAAEMLGCSTSTIQRMIEDGTIEAFKRRKGKRNSPWIVIRESVLRVADDWKQQVSGSHE